MGKPTVGKTVDIIWQELSLLHKRRILDPNTESLEHNTFDFKESGIFPHAVGVWTANLSQ